MTPAAVFRKVFPALHVEPGNIQKFHRNQTHPLRALWNGFFRIRPPWRPVRMALRLQPRPLLGFCRPLLRLGPQLLGLESALVRLSRQEDRTVEVRFCAVKNRAVSNRNCVPAMRRGEQREENDQSVTPADQASSHRELDSVGVSGRVFERLTKPVTAVASGRSPDNTQMVGNGMAGSLPAIIREARQCWMGALGKQSACLQPVGLRKIKIHNGLIYNIYHFYL